MSGLSSRILLRLDNGEVIGNAQLLGREGGAGVVRLGIEEVSAAGRLRERDVLRLSGFLSSARAADGLHAFPGASVDLGHLNGKRSASFVGGQGSHPAPKRRKSGNKDVPNGSEASLGGGSWHAGMDFRDKCRRIVDQVLNLVGEKDAWIFDQPVDARAVPDYYKIISEPICFQDIKKKLKLGPAANGYQTPQEFYDDVRLLWANCAKYNGAGTPIRRLGARGEARFDELWAASGFDTARHRRATAGIAAAKYEPNDEVGEKRPKKNGYDQFKRNGKRMSFKNQDHYDMEMPREQMEKLASFLGELNGEELDGILKIIREGDPNHVTASEGGEIELSFDDMSNPTLWRLEAHMRELDKKKKAYSNGNLRVLDSSDDDSDDSDPDL